MGYFWDARSAIYWVHGYVHVMKIHLYATVSVCILNLNVFFFLIKTKLRQDPDQFLWQRCDALKIFKF